MPLRMSNASCIPSTNCPYNFYSIQFKNKSTTLSGFPLNEKLFKMRCKCQQQRISHFRGSRRGVWTKQSMKRWGHFSASTCSLARRAKNVRPGCSSPDHFRSSYAVSHHLKGRKMRPLKTTAGSLTPSYKQWLPQAPRSHTGTRSLNVQARTWEVHIHPHGKGTNGKQEAHTACPATIKKALCL